MQVIGLIVSLRFFAFARGECLDSSAIVQFVIEQKSLYSSNDILSILGGVQSSVTSYQHILTTVYTLFETHIIIMKNAEFQPKLNPAFNPLKFPSKSERAVSDSWTYHLHVGLVS
jgi:hypothetical protein